MGYEKLQHRWQPFFFQFLFCLCPLCVKRKEFVLGDATRRSEKGGEGGKSMEGLSSGGQVVELESKIDLGELEVEKNSSLPSNSLVLRQY